MTHGTLQSFSHTNSQRWAIMWHKLFRTLSPLLGVGLFVLSLLVLSHELQAYHYHDFVRQVGTIPALQLLVAFGFVVFSYSALTGYEMLALRAIQRPLPYPHVALTSFVSYALSHTIGFAVLSGGAIRYRLYTTLGLSTLDITRVIAFCSLTFWLGFAMLGSVLFWCIPMPQSVFLPFLSLRLLGVVLLLLPAGYLAGSLLYTKPLQWRGWEFFWPSLPLAGSQIIVSMVDWSAAAAVLYLLLPANIALPYLQFLGMFLLAQMVGILSMVPGGLGVFDTIILLWLSPWISPPAMLGILLAYRALYYLLPFSIAVLVLGIHEVLQRRDSVTRIVQTAGNWLPLVIPHIFACTTFLSGAILLLSGATPAVPGRLHVLEHFFPLPVIEISHFLGSLMGVALLLLARGLQQRSNAAYVCTVGLLGAGILVSLLKGFDYEEATVLTVMLAALLPCHRHFYRPATLLSARFSPGWIAAIVCVLLGSIWLGMFSYKHLEYAHELWWRFALEGNAPRFLRATVGVLGTALAFALAALLRPTPAQPTLPSQAELDRVQPIIAQSQQASAHLALLGDKALLWSQTGQAFLMYGIAGRSWVALGDPLGSNEEAEELAWQFRALSDRHGGQTVFYEVGTKYLPLYLDLGLTPLKLGEEAQVALSTFTLEGRAHKSLRSVYNQLNKAGCQFTVVPPQDVAALLPELRLVSDAWLASKHSREKGFSLGCFQPQYLQRCPVALVRYQDQVVAFANLWRSADNMELSPDLMRYLPNAPGNVMEYLFIRLMLWGKDAGYQWFNLGMAPFSGLETRTLAPLWHRFGSFIFQHGEHFYNFQGVRHYKDKFGPLWQPKYLVAPGGLAVPRILTNIATLVSGGFRGILTK